MTAKGPPQPRRRVPMTMPMTGLMVDGAGLVIGSGITSSARNRP